MPVLRRLFGGGCRAEGRIQVESAGWGGTGGRGRADATRNSPGAGGRRRRTWEPRGEGARPRVWKGEQHGQ